MLALVRCWYGKPDLVGKSGETLELYGVPGPVRTANLPLRRGMLYPIELLGQMPNAYPEGLATDGVHLNGRGWFCHVVRWHFECRPIPANAFKASRCSPKPSDVSCKLHCANMPSLQTATSKPHKSNLTLCFYWPNRLARHLQSHIYTTNRFRHRGDHDYEQRPSISTERCGTGRGGDVSFSADQY